jgi:hypothetical protein
MDGQIQQTLDLLNDQLKEQDITSYKIGLADPKDLTLLSELEGGKNARFMTKATFDVLVEGVKNTGMSSMPFCYHEKDLKIVLSGNHRVMAAREAGKKSILYLYTDEHMSRQEQISLQLAHNQVTGQDDPNTLKDLWEELTSVDLKFLTGFDDDYFDKLKSIQITTIKESPLRTKEVMVLFIQEDLNLLTEARELIEKAAKKNPVFVAKYKDFNAFFSAVVDLKESENIINTATALRRMSEITIEYLKQQAEASEG